MKLSLFNGGLNTRQAPQLIQPNEAVESINVDSTNDVIQSTKEPVAASVELTQDSFWNPLTEEWQDREHDTTPVAYRNSIVKTGQNAERYINGQWYDLGIEEPENAPVVTNLSSALSFDATVRTVLLPTGISVSPTTGDPVNPSYEIGAIVYTKEGKVVKAIKTTRTVWPTDQDPIIPAPLPVEVDLNFISDTTGAASVSNLSVVWMFYQSGAFGEIPGWYIIDQSILGYPLASKTFTIGTGTLQASFVWPTEQVTISHDPAVTSFSLLVGFEGPSPITKNITRPASSTGYIHEVTLDIAVSSPSSLLLGKLEGGGHYFLDSFYYSELFPLQQAWYVANTIDITGNWEFGLPDGTYQWLYTFYSSLDGTESAPSPISVERTVSEQVVELTLVTETIPSSVDTVRLYRIGGTLTDFTLVKESTSLPSSNITIDDEVPDKLLIGAPTLNTSDRYAPPEGLKYLTRSQGIFWGAIEDTLYLGDDIGNPNYWNPANTLDFPATITGLVDAYIGLLVFTAYETYLVKGNSVFTVSQVRISGSQGCTNYKTIARGNADIWFVSSEGLCRFSGGAVEVVSRPKLSIFYYAPINAVFFNDCYYLQLSETDDNKLLVLDMKLLPKFYELSFGTSYLKKGGGKLYALNTSNTYELLQGEPTAEYSYRTGKLAEGAPTILKNYNNFYVRADGTHTIKIYIDGNLVSEHSLDGSKLVYDIAVPQQYRRGYELEFELSGIGTVYEIEYKVQGREK